MALDETTPATDTTDSLDTLTTDPLPVPVDIEPDDLPPAPDPPTPRTYLEIRPTETQLNPTDVVQAMDVLYSLLNERTKTGLRHALTRSTHVPRIEWLLVADGRPDSSVRYLVGSTDDELLVDLEGVLRTCFPQTYEFSEVEFHPRFVEDHLPLVAQDGHSTPTTSATARETTETTDTQTVDPHRLAKPYAAGVEYEGNATMRQDWQLPLTALYERTQGTMSAKRNHTTTSRTKRSNVQTQSARIPLATLIEAISTAEVPVVYQVVCRLRGDDHTSAEVHCTNLEQGTVTIGDRIWNELFPEAASDDADPPQMYRDRLEAIRDRDLRRTLTVSACAVALTRHTPDQADQVARRLASTLGHLGGSDHTITGRVATDSAGRTYGETPEGTQIYDALCERTVDDPTYETTKSAFPFTSNTSTGLIVTPAELPGFCLLDGGALTPSGKRALATRYAERTGLVLPSPQELARYVPPGQAIGMPLTHDRHPYGHALCIRPEDQRRHAFIVGDTGSGKSILMMMAALTNLDATDGPDIFFFHKAGTATELLQMYHGTYGRLDDEREILYFDLTEVLPALSFFDIRPLLEAGVSREEARSRKAGHYEEILAGVMGGKQYSRAPESRKAIRNTIRALFDPIHGADAFAHADLYRELQAIEKQETLPSVSEDALARYFTGLGERDRDMFKGIMGGATGRVETVATDGRLAPLFDHVAAHERSEHIGGEESGGHDPHFDFSEEIDEDTVIVFDFGGMEASVKRTLTLVLLSNLWTALKARAENLQAAANSPQVNCYFDEAADVADTKLMDTLLSQGRSFGLSIALGVQFPAQLDSADPDSNTYEEALNEIATVVAGNVSLAEQLAEALATPDMPPHALKRRLAAMPSGEWLVRPGSGFDTPTVRPFLAKSLPALPGHPASDQPLSGTDKLLFEAAFYRLKSQTFLDAGLAQVEAMTNRGEMGETDTDADSDATDESATQSTVRVDTLFPHTERIPTCVAYDEDTHSLRCLRCENRYDPSTEGMLRAIECCHSLDTVDRDDIPICEFNLKLAPVEIDASEWSVKQLLFLQAVYNAQQLRYDPLEYDLLTDSMLRLQEYVGIGSDAVRALLDADLLRHDTDHPHRLYTVTSDGRAVIGESYRQDVDYGHGRGDLEESTEHVFAVEVLRQYLDHEYVQNAKSAVVDVVPYYEIDEQRRLDVAGLDADGEIVVAGEVERVNHDIRRAVPEDFDKMADSDVEEAIWVVPKQAAGHKVLAALNDPLEGTPRVEKTYAETTPPQQFRIDTPGMTAIYPVGWLRDRLDGHDS
ncbi:hypothetical protein [Haladaptatus sp. NG-SE-30]